MHYKSAVVCTLPLQPIPLPDGAWDKLALDIVGPFDRALYRFAVTLVDYFRKWLEIAFMPQVNYSAVIQFLSTVFSHEGNLKELISDHSSQFMSCKFEIVFVKPRNYASDVTCVFTQPTERSNVLTVL